MKDTLAEKTCMACEGKVDAFTDTEVATLLAQIDDWKYDAAQRIISKTFTFKSYVRALTFVSAVGWMADKEKHHPDITLSYNKVVVCYTTHAISGMSENDFICAAKVDKLAA